MAMQLTRYRRAGDYLRATVWLDNTKFDVDGISPDPAWVRRYEFAANPPPGMAQADYNVEVRREIKRRARFDLEVMQPSPEGSALPGEGQEIV